MSGGHVFLHFISPLVMCMSVAWRVAALIICWWLPLRSPCPAVADTPIYSGRTLPCLVCHLVMSFHPCLVSSWVLPPSAEWCIRVLCSWGHGRMCSVAPFHQFSRPRVWCGRSHSGTTNLCAMYASHCTQALWDPPWQGPLGYHRDELASCGVLDGMAEGWCCDLDMIKGLITVGGSYGNDTRVISCPALGRPHQTTNHERPCLLTSIVTSCSSL